MSQPRPEEDQPAPFCGVCVQKMEMEEPNVAQGTVIAEEITINVRSPNNDDITVTVRSPKRPSDSSFFPSFLPVEDSKEEQPPSTEEGPESDGEGEGDVPENARSSKDDLLGPKGKGEAPKLPPQRRSALRIDDVHPLSMIATVGGFLCLNSGWVNAVAFRGFDGGVTHVTGTSTNVGLNLAKGNILLHLRASAKLAAFFLGAAASSAYLGGNRTFKSGPRYAHLLVLVAGSIFAAYAAERAGLMFAGALALSFGSGAQNALTTVYSGGVARTTHVTGTVTDMGVEIGKVLFHGDHSGMWKLKLLTTFFGCYVLGGFLGALFFSPEEIEGVDFVGAEARALLVPGAATLALAAAWLFRHGGEMDPIEGAAGRPSLKRGLTLRRGLTQLRAEARRRGLEPKATRPPDANSV